MSNFKYKVLLVDDEPILLSGMRAFLDWEKEDCILLPDARNGQEALDIIQRESPHIVITDLKMPVMDGLKLLEKAFELYPNIVFVIVTSLEDLNLARQAIRYNVSDYLLKSELDNKLLSQTINRAKKEYNKRVPIEKLNLNTEEVEEDKVAKVVSNLFIMRDIGGTEKLILEKKGLTKSFAILSFFFSFPISSLDKNWKISDYKKLAIWEKELVEKILFPSFPSIYSVQPIAGKNSRLIYYIADVNPDTWNSLVNRVNQRVEKTSRMITSLSLTCKASSVYSDKDEIIKARDEIEYASMCYYLSKDRANSDVLRFEELFPIFERAITKKDIVLIKAAFNRLLKEIKENDHTLDQVLFGLNALISALNSGFNSMGFTDKDSIEYFRAYLHFISKRSEVINLIEDLQELTLSQYSVSDNTNQITDKARMYIIEHIKEKISLNDVADAACVSPGYLSRTFKKEIGVNLVDYINKLKIEKAQTMMQNGNNRINELALSLGFDNVYYFSKVFKKVSTMAPRDYLKSLGE